MSNSQLTNEHEMRSALKVNQILFFDIRLYLFLSHLYQGKITMNPSKNPSDFTVKANQKILQDLPFSDKADFEAVNKGFIAPLPNNGDIKSSDGKSLVWSLKDFAFVEGQAPDSVNPSLWRQSQLLVKAGLFQVCERVYQIRSADLSNMTIIEGEKGIIVIDPLVSTETAKAALDLYYAHRPKRPVVAMIYTHSHADHYGGASGVVSAEDVANKRVRIIAPVGFTEAALAEI